MMMASLLLVEDDALISRMISLRLRAKGHEVDHAVNGREGVEKTLETTEQAAVGRHGIKKAKTVDR